MTLAMMILTAAIITAIFFGIGIASVRLDRLTEQLADHYVLTHAPQTDRDDRHYAERVAGFAAVGLLVGGSMFAVRAWMSSFSRDTLAYAVVALLLLQCGLWFTRVARRLRSLRAEK